MSDVIQFPSPEERGVALERFNPKPLLALGAAVLAIDVLSDTTITTSFQQALETPRGRVVALGALSLTVAHLTGVMPRSLDIFYLHERLQNDT